MGENKEKSDAVRRILQSRNDQISLFAVKRIEELEQLLTESFEEMEKADFECYSTGKDLLDRIKEVLK